MNPRLIAGKELQVATPSRDRGAAQAALAVLLVGVAAVGLAQRGTDPGLAESGTQPVVVASPAAGATMIVGTAVPAPPTTFATASARTRRGTFLYEAPGATAADMVGLFGLYLQAMPAQGWTLLAKGDPTTTGAWTQRWQAGRDAGLLTMSTRPRRELTLMLCPPNPYC